MIIFLNGVSSSGKSSIAKSLQLVWPTPLLHIGVDDFVNMLPSRFVGESEEAEVGLRFFSSETKSGRTVEIRQGEYARRLFNGMVSAIAELARAGNDIVLDEVLLGDHYLEKYVATLSALPQIDVWFVAIQCPLEAVEERERKRGDRILHSAKSQFPLVHGPTRFYDLEVDSSKLNPTESAQLIRAFVANGDGKERPRGFAKLAEAFKLISQ